MFLRLKHIGFLLCLCAASAVHAFDDCAENLKTAERYYEEGKIDEVAALITPCLDANKFKIEDKKEAIRLLVLVALFDDNTAEAEKQMRRFLRNDPEYKITPADPEEFVQLYNNFRTLPVFSIGFSAGLTRSYIELSERHGVYDLSNNTPELYANGMGLMGSIHAQKTMFKYLLLDVGFNFSNRKFLYTTQMFDFAEVELAERQQWLDVPLSAHFVLPKGTFRPYIGIGVSTGFLLTSKGDFSRTYLNESEVKLADIKASDINLNDKRNKHAFWTLYKLGVLYKVKKGYFSLDITYRRGINDMVDENKRYSNPELTYKYYYIDEGYIMDNLDIQIGYIRHFYSPKLKHKPHPITE